MTLNKWCFFIIDVLKLLTLWSWLIKVIRFYASYNIIIISALKCTRISIIVYVDIYSGATIFSTLFLPNLISARAATSKRPQARQGGEALAPYKASKNQPSARESSIPEGLAIALRIRLIDTINWNLSYPSKLFQFTFSLLFPCCVSGRDNRSRCCRACSERSPLLRRERRPSAPTPALFSV